MSNLESAIAANRARIAARIAANKAIIAAAVAGWAAEDRAMTVRVYDVTFEGNIETHALRCVATLGDCYPDGDIPGHVIEGLTGSLGSAYDGGGAAPVVWLQREQEAS